MQVTYFHQNLLEIYGRKLQNNLPFTK
jgi:hypothetical protein